jgi:hypothetical protein
MAVFLFLDDLIRGEPGAWRAGVREGVVPPGGGARRVELRVVG